MRTSLPLLMALVLTGAGCSRTPPPAAAPSTAATAADTTAAAPANTTATAPANTTAVRKNDGRPRIAFSGPERVHIQYRVYGQGQPTVLLIHGWSCDSNYWAAQIKPLAAHYTVVTVDLAGHGASGANRSDFSMASFAGDVAAVADALPATSKLILVGHSMGGPVAVEAAGLLADRVIGIVAVDSLQGIGTKPPSAAQNARMLAPFEKDFIGATRKLVASAFFRKDADPIFMRRVADDMSQAPPSVALPALRALNSWDGTRQLAALRVPLIAINSDLHGPTNESRIRAVAPTFRAVTIPGTDHFLMMERPDVFNAELLKQLAALGGG